MSKPITKIQMTGFRGAVQTFELDFDPKKDFTILFGENGTGKSSILDALDVICCGTNGCLDGISAGQNSSMYLRALGCPSTTLKVIVHSNNESWTGTMRGNSIRVDGPVVKPKVKILRRKAITELVLAQPNKRYEALRSFIEIGGVEQSEGTLKQKLTNIERELSTAIDEKARMIAQLDDLWKAEGCPGAGQDAMAWAEGKVTVGIGGLNDRLERLKAVTIAIAEVATAKSNLDARAVTLDKASEELKRIDQQIADMPSIDSAATVRLLTALEKAKAYVEADTSLDKCPTCHRPIGRELLLSTINAELLQLGDIKKLSDAQQKIQGAVREAASFKNDAMTGVIQALKKVHETTQDGEIPEMGSLAIASSSWHETMKGAQSLDVLCGELHGIQASLGSQRDSTQQDLNQFNAIKGLWTGINDNGEKVVDLTRMQEGLKKAFDIVHDKRVAFTQGILDGIQQEANHLFQAIHPGENLGLEQLKMIENRRGSIDQTGLFYGHASIPPQAVFSESHLDTLGFCVWLALAKRETPNEVILLIDDVFSSVDATHLDRIIDLISAEAPNFLRVVVATHYRRWWERCDNAQGIQRVQLGQWNAINGIAAQNMPRVLDELRGKIAEPILDRQAVASKAGILLECILDGVTVLYKCSLPRNKQNQFTLGDLMGACKKLFLKHNLTVQINTNWNVDDRPENWQATTAGTDYERVNKLQFIRNQVGCHFNVAGMDIPDRDVHEFGAATIALVEALICPNCGMLATKTANDGTHLRCSCPKKAARMTPVSLP